MGRFDNNKSLEFIKQRIINGSFKAILEDFDDENLMLIHDPRIQFPLIQSFALKSGEPVASLVINHGSVDFSDYDFVASEISDTDGTLAFPYSDYTHILMDLLSLYRFDLRKISLELRNDEKKFVEFLMGKKIVITVGDCFSSSTVQKNPPKEKPWCTCHSIVALPVKYEILETENNHDE